MAELRVVTIDSKKNRQNEIKSEIESLNNRKEKLQGIITSIGLPMKEDIKETIPSYEVAKMVDRSHADILKMLEGQIDKNGKVKIVGIIPTLTKGELPLLKYFIKSSYIDSKGENRKCYDCTKLGCEMIANKITGEKGILFTAKYVKRFNEMEQQLQQANIPSVLIEDRFDRLDRYKVEMAIEELKQIELHIGKLNEENDKLKAEIKNDTLTHSGKTYTTTEIAKELGKSARELNKILKDKNIQFKQNNTWVLYSKYQSKDFTEQKQEILDNGKVVYYTRWTDKGREFILDLLLNKGE